MLLRSHSIKPLICYYYTLFGQKCHRLDLSYRTRLSNSFKSRSSLSFDFRFSENPWCALPLSKSGKHVLGFSCTLLLSAQAETHSGWKSEVTFIRRFWSSFCISLLIAGKKLPAGTDTGVRAEKECDWKYFPSPKVEVVHAKQDDSCVPRDALPCTGAALSVNSDGRRRREITLTCNDQMYEN